MERLPLQPGTELVRWACILWRKPLKTASGLTEIARTLAGLASARARGRKGGRPHALSKAQVRLAQAAMAQRDTKVSELCLELGVTKATIYRYVAPDGSLRNRGRQVLAR